MASSLDEQLDVLLLESKRVQEQSATLAERARGCCLSLADLSAKPPRTLS